MNNNLLNNDNPNYFLFIDSRISDISGITTCLTNNTDYFIFNFYENTTTELINIINLNNKTYDAIGIIQHYRNNYYQLVSDMTLINILDYDSWSPLINFLQQLPTKYIDFLTCNFWNNNFYKLRDDYNLYVRGSLNITGVNGDFILESDNVNLIGIYFTDNINNYQYNFNLTQVTPYFIINSKTYDGTSTAYIQSYTLSGLAFSDINNITLSSSVYALYSSINVNSNILVNIYNIYLFGPNSDNYIINTTNTSTANITERTIFVFGNEKNYDGNTNATLTLSNTISGDIVYYTAKFVDKNVGTNKTINVSLSSTVPMINITDISGCVLWLDAFDPYNTGVQPSDGQYVKSWVDKSGLNNSATSISGVLWNNNTLNSLPSFYFTNQNTTLQNFFAGNISINSSTVTIFFISTILEGSGIAGRIIGFFNGNDPNSKDNWDLTINASGSTYSTSRYYFYTLYAMSNQTPNYSEPYLTEFWYDNERAYASIFNGPNTILSTGNPNSGPFSAISQYYIGTSRPDEDGGRLNGYISEIIVFNTVLTTEDRQKVEGYLAWKWNIQTKLPSSHSDYIHGPGSILKNTNYILFNYITSSNIYKKLLTLSPTVIKFYDKTPNALLTSYTINGIVSGDNVDISSTYTIIYSDFNASTNVAVTISNILLYRSSSSNYYIQSYLITNGVINKRFIYGITSDKIYDQTTNYNLTISNIVSGDIITYYSAFNSDLNAGIKTVFVTLSGITQTNNNYQFFSNLVNINVLKKQITGIYNPIVKTYDGTTNVYLSLQSTSGYFFSDYESSILTASYLIPYSPVTVLGSPSIAPWSLNNFPDSSANWIWSVAYPSPNLDGVQFQKLYNNTTNSNINGIMYYGCDNSGEFYLNGSYQGILNYTNNNYSSLNVTIQQGINLFEFKMYTKKSITTAPSFLTYTVYDIYFFSDPNFFNNNTTYRYGGTGSYTGLANNILSITAGTNGYVPASSWSSFSVQWLGYFRPDVTGSWTFYTTSDDGSFLWLGPTAVSGYTSSNALVNNGGNHGAKEISGTIFLVANISYPIKIQYGNNDLGYTMIVSFQGPSTSIASTKTTNGDGFYFSSLVNYPAGLLVSTYSNNNVLFRSDSSFVWSKGVQRNIETKKKYLPNSIPVTNVYYLFKTQSNSLWLNPTNLTISDNIPTQFQYIYTNLTNKPLDSNININCDYSGNFYQNGNLISSFNNKSFNIIIPTGDTLFEFDVLNNNSLQQNFIFGATYNLYDFNTNTSRSDLVYDISNINFAINNNLTDNYLIEVFGFIKTINKNIYPIYFVSNDYTYFWLGQNSLSGYTPNNTSYIIKNSGYTYNTLNLSLESNTMVPFRLQYYSRNQTTKLNYILPIGNNYTISNNIYLINSNNTNDTFLTLPNINNTIFNNRSFSIFIKFTLYQNNNSGAILCFNKDSSVNNRFMINYNNYQTAYYLSLYYNSFNTTISGPFYFNSTYNLYLTFDGINNLNLWIYDVFSKSIISNTSLVYDSNNVFNNYNFFTIGRDNVTRLCSQLTINNVTIFEDMTLSSTIINNINTYSNVPTGFMFNYLTVNTINTDLYNLITTKGPWGIYSAEIFNNNTLYEITGNGRNASCTGVSYTTGSGNGATSSIPYLFGSITSTIIWPTGSIPNTFTICSVTRYTGGVRGRILSSTGNNGNYNNYWYHGHYNGQRGVCRYETWLTSTTGVGSVDTWVVTCGKSIGTISSNILVDGFPRGISTISTGSSATLTINSSYISEPSDWAFSCVFIWDQLLTDSEMVIVSNFLLQHLSTGMSIRNILSQSIYSTPSFYTKTGFTKGLQVTATDNTNNQVLFTTNTDWKSTIGQQIIPLQSELSLLNYTANYITPNSGINIPVTISNIILAGSNNYTLTQPTLSGTINKALITVNITSTKTYDKTLVAPLTSYTLSGVISGDLVDISNVLVLTHNTYDISSSYIINITPIILKGKSSSNYTTVNNVIATINPKVLNPISLVKTYDTNNFLFFDVSGTISGDVVGTIGYYDSMNVGNRMAYLKLINSNVLNVFYYTVTNPFSAFNTLTVAYAYSGDGNTSASAVYGGGYLYFSKLVNGSWTSFTQVPNSFNGTYFTVTLNYDGTILIAGSTGGTNFYLWNGTNYDFSKQITSLNTGAYISPTSNFLVLRQESGPVFWATWTGTTFSNLTQTADTVTGAYRSINVSKDNKRIVFCSSYVYWADWNGTNFNKATQILDNTVRMYPSCRITTNKNVIFVSTLNDTTSSIYYTIWNRFANNYGPLIPIGNLINYQLWNIDLSFDDNFLYTVLYNSTGAFITFGLSYLTNTNNYTITNTTTSGIINKCSLIGYANNKIYDNTSKASFTVNGYHIADILTISNVIYNSNKYANFNNIYVGNKIPITLSSTIFNNYQIINSLSGNITPLSILPIFSGINKYYDTIKNAQVNFISLSGVYFSDIPYVSLSNTYISVFDFPNVGIRNIQISGLKLYNYLAYNYNLVSLSSVITATINPRYITAKGVDKYYDGTDIALLSLSGLLSVSGFVTSTIVQPPTGIFTSKNIGTNITINITNNTPLGSYGTNYVISNLTTTANILQKPVYNILTTKVYDGTNIGYYSLSGIVFGDSGTISGSVLLQSSNVGTTILSICGFVSNTNYILQTFNYQYTITPKEIIPYFTVNAKTYDKILTNPNISYTLSGILNNNLVDICNNFIAIYRTNNTGFVFVDISNISLYGLHSFNYFINNTKSVLTYVNKYNIYGYPLDKIYDGTTTLFLNISGLLPNDTIIYTANYASKNIGINTLEPVISDGPYNIIYSNQTATILPLMLTPIITTNKSHDIQLYFTLSGIIYLDDPVSFTYLQPNYNVAKINYLSSDLNFIDISAQWIWTVSGIAPLNSIGYQFQYLYTNLTNNIINATVQLLSYDVCNFYLNGNYISSANIGLNNKINITIPLGTSIFEFESFNLGSSPNYAGILVSVIDDNNNVLFRSDTTWVYSVNIPRTSKYNSVIYVSNYNATISSIIDNNFVVYYYGLTLSGPNSSNYIISDGFYYESFLPTMIYATFNCNEKIYDKIITASVTYTLSGILPEHIGNVDICSNYIAQYRHYNASNFAIIDITNISLYGYKSNFYTINSSSLTSTIIDQRYLFVINGDKQYDKTNYAYLTLSNNILNDTIIYSAYFNNYYVGQNKIINITLSNTINESINNLLYKLSTYYSFNNNTIQNLYVANLGNYNIVYDALLSKLINIDTSGMKIESGCLTLNYNNQEYLTLPNNLTDNNGLTFAFWFKANNTPLNSRIFELSNGFYDKIYFGIYNNYICCGVYNDIFQDYYNFYTVNVNDNKWRHVVWILQTNYTWLIYVDNVLVNTNINSLYPNAKLRTVNYIGKYFNGSIDDFRIYNRCLDNTDINNLYNNNVFNLNNANYLLYQNTFYGSIVPRVVQVLGNSVIYNSNNTVTLYFANKISSDNIDISTNYTANYLNYYAQKNQLISYNNLTIYGTDISNYSCSLSGVTTGDINPALLQVKFNTNKYYDKNAFYTPYYTISGYYNADISYITLSSSIYGLFRNNKVGLTQVDISNIYLYGQSASNYYLLYNKITVSGYISQKVLNPIIPDKIYDKTYDTVVTLSGSVQTDLIGYYSKYNDYNAGNNKQVYVTLSGYQQTVSGSIYYSFITNFGPVTTPWSTASPPTTITGFVMNGDQTRALVCNYTDGFIYLSTYNGSTWSTFTKTLQTTSLGNLNGIALTPDGSRGAVVFRNGLIYFFTWTGSNYSTLTQTLDATVRTYMTGIDITADGSKILVNVFNGYVYYATWNGSNYSTFIQTLDTTTRSYMGCAITSDGTYIAVNAQVGVNTYIYIAKWNGTNYDPFTAIDYASTTVFGTGRSMRFSSDGKYLFYGNYGGVTTMFYSVWNGFTYSPMIRIPTSVTNPINDGYGVYVANNLSYLYITGYNFTTINRIQLQIPSYNTTTVNNNLQYYYTFNANKLLYNEVTNLYDASMNNNPRISISDYIVGNGSLVLDASSNQYLQLPAFTIGSNGITFALWFKSNNTSISGRILEFSNGISSDNIYIGINNSNIMLGIYLISNLSLQVNNVFSSVNDNQWRHLVWIINPNGSWTVYVNCTVIYTINATYPRIINRSINYIGKSAWQYPYFNGSIDDFRVYNTVLTTSDVIYLYAHYNNLNFNPIVSYSVTNDYLNYQLTTNFYYGNILQKLLNVALNGIGKTYDGTSNAQFTYSITNIITGDSVDISNNYIATYNDQYIGNNKLITISNLVLYLASAQNYTISNYIYTFATISQRIITAQYYCIDKFYDTTTTASIYYNIYNLVQQDISYVDISSNYTATYNNANAGYNKPVTIANLSLYKPLSYNYILLPTINTISGTINKKFLTPTVLYKQYDQTTNVIVTLSGFFNNDFISNYSYFDTNQAGINKNIYITLSYIITPSGIINYQVANTTGNLYKREIIGNIINANKPYDGTIEIYNAKLTLSGVLTNDIVTISSFISYYNNSNAGYQSITISDYTFGGKDMYNYLINYSLKTNYGSILKKSLLIYYNPVTTIYSGYLFNSHSVSYNGFILGEGILALSGSLHYAISLDTTTDIRNVFDINKVNYLIGGNRKVSKTIGYSYNGITWYNSNNNPFSNNCINADTDNNIWVAVGNGTNTIAYSNDGINWTGLGLSIFTLVGYGIIYYKNKWIAVGQGTNTIATSTDGINWSGQGNTIFSIYGKSVKASTYIIVAIGQGDNTLAYSYDGNSWYGLGATLFNNYGNDILFNGVMWLALGKGTSNTMAYSYDGINWIGLGNSIFSDYASSGDWDGNKWVFVGSGTNTLAYSYDGLIWVGLGTSVFNDFGKTVIYDGTKWLASGNTGLIFVKSNDGFNWSDVINTLDINYAFFIKCKKSIKLYEQTELIDYGNYFIKPLGYYSNNYSITYLGDYTFIQKALLTIEPYTFNKIYDATINYNNNIIYTGFKGSDNSSNLLGNLIYLTDVKPDVGSYYITISGLYALNYNIINKVGKITITKAPLIIKTDNFIKIYDASSYTPTYTIIGLQSSLSGNIIFGGTYLNKKDVGTYTIIPYGVSSYNYNIKFVPSILQITKTPLMVIAKDDSRFYTTDISNYVLVYTREDYILTKNNLTKNTIQSLVDFVNYDRVWSLEGYDGPCELNFDFIGYNTFIGLTEINYKTTNTNYMQYFLYFDSSNNVYIDNVLVTTNNTLNNYKIKYDGNNVIYYKNDIILSTTTKNYRTKLYINILFKNKNTTVSNIRFNNNKEYYYGGNGLVYNGFKGNDTYLSLSGNIIYGGTSQGASEEGIYYIIPSGVSSNNYDIRFITGQLNIKKSMLTSGNNF